MNEGIRKSLSPFERLREQYNNLPAKEAGHIDRDLVLGDGTEITLVESRPYPSSPICSYKFVCRPANRHRNTPGQEIRFAVGEEGLEWVELPDQEFRVGGVTVHETKSARHEYKGTKENGGKAATALADWVDRIVTEGKYSPPPFSIAMLTEFEQS
ncbi:MAG: hypothetical protein M1372_02445 [Patescibacteria group bacterium]|nr:hypothetical protein [Patescibacteria group bacterium]